MSKVECGTNQRFITLFLLRKRFFMQGHVAISNIAYCNIVALMQQCFEV